MKTTTGVLFAVTVWTFLGCSRVPQELGSPEGIVLSSPHYGTPHTRKTGGCRVGPLRVYGIPGEKAAGQRPTLQIVAVDGDTGESIRGATIKFVDAGRRGTEAATITNRIGMVFLNAPPGLYQISFEERGYEGGSAMIRIYPERSDTILFEATRDRGCETGETS